MALTAQDLCKGPVHTTVECTSKPDQTISHLDQIDYNAHLVRLHVNPPWEVNWLDSMCITSISRGHHTVSRYLAQSMAIALRCRYYWCSMRLPVMCNSLYYFLLLHHCTIEHVNSANIDIQILGLQSFAYIVAFLSLSSLNKALLDPQY